MGALRAVRSALSLLLVVLWLAVPGALWLYLVVVPLSWLRPDRRVALVSWYMKGMTRGILGCLGLGGARFERRGTLPTREPALILMNHQSLLDILTVTLMAEPDVPAFVTRVRYARFVPLVSRCIRLLGCPVIDPRRDPQGAVATIERVARETARSILIFPEGHRSRDGALRPFKAAGTQAALRGRPLPVYLVASDGMWASRRFVDFLFNVHRVRGVAEVIGPFEPPAPDDVPAFVERARSQIAERLALLRRQHAAA
jgi:1-acyl-sn-glycerol-3-phosphate acyltransferase